MSKPEDFIIENGVLEKYTGSDAVVVIPDSVTSIGYKAFYMCKGLTSIEIPDSVTSVGAGAFYYCTGLTKVNYTGTLGQWAQINFSGSSSNPIDHSKNLYINDVLVTDGVIEDGVTSISDYAFYNCQSLKSITIPDSVAKIGYAAFEGCKGIIDISIPDSVILIENMSFSDVLNVRCSRPLPYSGAKSVNGYVEGYLAYADSSKTEIVGCAGSAVEVTIPDSVTDIAHGAFSGCSSLKVLKVSEGNKTFDSRDNCNAVIRTKSNNLVIGCPTTVIPKSVVRILAHSFYKYESLGSITIPETVAKISDTAFFECGLSLIKYYGTDKKILDWDHYCESASDFNIKIFAPYMSPDKFTSPVLRKYALLGFADYYKTENIPDEIKNAYIDSLKKRYSEFYFCLKDNFGLLNFYIDNKIIPLRDVDKLTEEIDDVENKANLLNYKEKAFSTEEKERTEESKLELALGMREMSLSEWREIYKFSIKVGFVFISGYKGTDTDITIPSKMGKYKVISIGKNAFSKINLNSITLPDTIEEIEEGAFNFRGITIKCEEDSYAHEYAMENNIKFELIEG